MSETSMLIVGVGDGGCNALADMTRRWPDHPPMLAVNTADWAGGVTPNLTVLKLGAAQLKGAGAGGDPRIGQRVMEGELAALRPHLENTRLVLMVAGLGGGTGTGAAPLIMAAARKAGALALGLAMLPFDFESRRRREQAAHGLLALQEVSDGVVCLPNQCLLGSGADTVNVEQLFESAHQMLCRCLQSLWYMIERRGVINVSAADLCALVRAGNGRCLMACVRAAGPDKAARAAELLARHPLLDSGAALARAPSWLLHITGGPDLTLREVNLIVAKLTALGADATLAMTGMVCDPAFQDQLGAMIFMAEKNGAAQRLVPAMTAASAPGRASVKTVGASRRKPTQLSLFGPQAGGRFAGVAPTIMDSENLDKPTFMRRGLPIQKVRDTDV